MMGADASDRQLLRRAWLFWLFASAVALATGWGDIADLVTRDPDDALRMVQVRDLVAGQAWWDLGQHRINPVGGGGLMHWSRIVDAPLAGGIALLTPLLGAWWAERLVFTLWPLMLMAPLFLVMARIGLALHDRAVAAWAPLLLATSMTIVHQFAPLRVDHHGWQILLSGALLLLMLRPANAGGGLLMGVLAAVLLAISLEGLPLAALFAALMGMEWIWSGAQQARRRLSAYLAALSIAAVVLQLLTRGPGTLFQNWCDALSLPWLAALAVAAALAIPFMTVAAGWEAIGLRGRMIRAASLLVAGIGSGAALIAIEPACTRGPFASLDPLVVTYWYSQVREGLPLWGTFDSMIGYSLAPTLVGLAGTALALRQVPAQNRRAWLLLTGSAMGAALLSLFVMRALYFAHLFALPGCAWLVSRLWLCAREQPSAGARIAASGALLLALPPVSVLVAVHAIDAAGHASGDLMPSEELTDRTRSCVNDASIDALQGIEPGLILAPLDIGPHLLQYTRHSVAATGHHRNNKVMGDTIRTFTGDSALAEARARRLGAQLIIICPGAPEWSNFLAVSGRTFARQLTSGPVPAWLESLPLGDSGLRGWRVLPVRPGSTRSLD